MLTIRTWLLIGIVVVFLGGGLTFLASTQREEHPKEVLGEAQIVVYKKGETIVLDTKSPYFKELQLACEAMLGLQILYEHMGYSVDCSIWQENEWENNSILEQETKNKEWAVELMYAEPQVIYPIQDSGMRRTPTEVSRLLIPLSGELTHYSYQGKVYTYLFLFPEEFNYPRADSIGKGTKKDVREIKELLRKFEIEVP
jgi:hypothetical protein